VDHVDRGNGKQSDGNTSGTSHNLALDHGGTSSFSFYALRITVVADLRVVETHDPACAAIIIPARNCVKELAFCLKIMSGGRTGRVHPVPSVAS
jgi:hypothetical protein